MESSYPTTGGARVEIGRKRADERARKCGIHEDRNRAYMPVFAWRVCRYVMRQCVQELLSQSAGAAARQIVIKYNIVILTMIIIFYFHFD